MGPLTLSLHIFGDMIQKKGVDIKKFAPEITSGASDMTPFSSLRRNAGSR